MDIKCEIAADCALGEGPLWVPETGTVWWVDIIKADLHALDTRTGHHEQRRLPEALTSLGLREGGGFVGTSWSRFVEMNSDMQITALADVQEPDQPENRFNDGKVDAGGRFWAGTMHADLGAETGALYRRDRQGIARVDAAYTVTNGPAFSPDGRKLYHTSTTDGVIFVFDLDPETGAIAAKRPFVRIPNEDGLPDGMTVDENGDLWVCHYFGGRITQFSPLGEKRQHVAMPATCITSCTFGGDALDTLYVTTANQSLDAERKSREPLAGGLFSFKPGVKGLPPNRFRG